MFSHENNDYKPTQVDSFEQTWIIEYVNIFNICRSKNDWTSPPKAHILSGSWGVYGRFNRRIWDLQLTLRYFRCTLEGLYTIQGIESTL